MNPPAEIVLTMSNVAQWPKFKKLLDEGKIIADKRGRLRYLHGAPVGRLILTRVLKDGTPRYQESAKEWFDPEKPESTGVCMARVTPNHALAANKAIAMMRRVRR